MENSVIIKRNNKNFVMHKIGNETLLVPVGSHVMDINALVTLNVTGRYIWEILKKKHSVNKIVSEISLMFDVDLATADIDVKKFLDELIKLGGILL